MIFKALTILFLLTMTIGCSLFQSDNKSNKQSVIRESDYVEYYKSLGNVYLSSNEVVAIKLKKESQDYIKRIFNRILVSNELLLSKSNEVSFYVVVNSSPFVFSLPGDKYFFSSGLFEKYLKSEELFIATFAAEIVKSKRNLYEKKTLYPLGFVSTEKILDLTRIGFEYKKQLNEWTYIVLKRSGFDSSAYLNWIQVQNRNSLDFSLYLGESINISNEEQAFKNFMSKQGIISIDKKINESNSSKDFYEFLKDISKGKK